MNRPTARNASDIAKAINAIEDILDRDKEPRAGRHGLSLDTAHLLDVVNRLCDDWRRLDASPPRKVARGQNACCWCASILDGVRFGAGDGTGTGRDGFFACRECYTARAGDCGDE
jgi:hypothetical protein